MNILWISIPVILYVAVTLFFYLRVFYRRSHKRFLSQSHDLKGIDYSFFKTDQAWFLNHAQKITLTLKSSSRQGYLLETDKNKPLVLLLHGYTSHALSMASFAKTYHEKYGFNTCAIDALGHGLSDGNFIGFGYAERNDVYAWLDMLRHLGFTGPVLLHGISMGASTALYAKSMDTQNRIQGVIADSPFIDLKPIFMRQAKQIWNLPSQPFLATFDGYMHLFNGYGFKQLNLFDQCSTFNEPLLILHGTKDLFVPYTQSIVFKEKTPTVDLVLIENSAHACGIHDEPTFYLNSVDAYLKKIQF